MTSPTSDGPPPTKASVTEEPPDIIDVTPDPMMAMIVDEDSDEEQP